jgi:hypothetical protein
MKTQELFTVLEQHQNKQLLFEYAPNNFVGANYHITEVKHIAVDSVDCGAQTDSWKETIVQLWESPLERGKTEFMSVKKALEILKKVGEMKPYVLDAEIKFEYSNNTFHTAQLFVDDYQIRDHKIVITLAIEKTDCKAKELCGVPASVVDMAEKVADKAQACCTPESGCC